MSFNWLRNSGSAADTHQTQTQEHALVNKGYGKFSDLSEFMTVERGYKPNYKPGVREYVDRGHIIYIKDIGSGTDTRINGRVMLVLFHNLPFSYTCLSFCCHPNLSGATLQNTLARVCTTENTPSTNVQQPAAGLPSLEVKVYDNDNAPCSLQPNVYINYRELWNVEKEVQLVIIGEVQPSSYTRLLPKISDSFRQSLVGPDPAANNARLQVPIMLEPPSSKRRRRESRGNSPINQNILEYLATARR